MARFPAEFDATALAHAIRSGATTATRAMEASLEAASEFSDLGAVSFQNAQLGLSQAAALQNELARSSEKNERIFAGVPFLMKDLGAATAGLPTVAGSKALARRFGPSTADSALSARFKAAGLLPFGTTTVSEFGMALSSEPPTGPAARNPADPGRTPGGSSGGAAAAVAAGIVAIAHATDAAGSTRVPAACCGLVGLKTTRGALPAGPDYTNYLSGLVSEFVLTRSLRDAAAALVSLAGRAQGPGPDPQLIGSQPFTAPLDSLRIGVLGDFDGSSRIDAQRLAGLESARGVLARAGHTIIPMEPAPLHLLARHSLKIVIDLVCANLARGLSAIHPPIAPDEIEPLCFATYQRGIAMSATALCESELSMARIAHRLWQIFDDVDVVLLPMLSAAPPPIGHFSLRETDIDRHWAQMTAFAPFATLANVGGIPALSVPHGEDSNGFSIPVQLIGPMGSDLLLLRVARVLEQATPWSFSHPVAGLPTD